ncbi:AraC family transcriptional regulator [Myroides sp. LJL116]
MNAINYLKTRQQNHKGFPLLLCIVILSCSLQCVLSLLHSSITVIYLAAPVVYLYSESVIKSKRLPNILVLVHLLGAVVLITAQFFYHQLIFLLVQICYLMAYCFLISANSLLVNKDTNKKSQVNLIIIYSNFMGAFAIVQGLYFLLYYFEVPHVIENSFMSFSLSLICLLFLVITSYYMDKITLVNSLEKGVVGKEPNWQTAQKKVELSPEASVILAFLQTNKQVLHPSFNLEDLAFFVQLTKMQVYEVIHKELAINFSQLVAKYRIDYAKVLLQENQNLTIEAIMEESGFNSKSTFNKYFKLFVGLTPSVYRSNALVI